MKHKAHFFISKMVLSKIPCFLIDDLIVMEWYTFLDRYIVCKRRLFDIFEIIKILPKYSKHFYRAVVYHKQDNQLYFSQVRVELENQYALSFA